MDQKTIELAGIVRNLPDNRVADGTMQEVINLRPEDGAWRPVGRKESFPMATADIRFIHTINESYKVYLGTPGGTLWYWVYENGIIQASVNTSISLIGKQIAFSQLHNTIIMNNITDHLMYTLVFDVNSERYRVFDSGLPELPTITLSRINHPASNESITVTLAPYVADGTMMLSQALALIGKHNKEVPVGPVAIRFAWELSNGEIVKHTAPIHMPTSYVSISNIALHPTQMDFRLNFFANKIRLNTNFTTEELAAIKSQYMGVIRSLNVYMTRCKAPTVNPYDLSDAYTEGIDDPNKEMAPQFEELSLIDETGYYLIHSITIEDLDNIETFHTDSYSGSKAVISGSFTDIETRPSLPSDNFSNHIIAGKSLFGYNDRVFLGDIKTTLYAGQNVFRFIGSSTDTIYLGDPYSVTLEVDIHTSDGIKTVQKYFSGFRYYLADGTTPSFSIKRYFAYPDARAKTLRIYVRVGSGTSHLVATLPLTAHELMNFAWYNGETVEDEITVYGNYTFTGPVADYPVASPRAVNNHYFDQNRIQLTEQSNPFYFPAINSYRCGNGNVIGMATNAEALSTGQFGQFPVYVFTTDGIWALTIGTGDPLIQSIVPVSREVCNNARSITQIDGGVAFTTEKGLYIISGAKPVEISDLVEGRYLSRLTGTVNYEAIANNPNLYQVKAYLCNTSLLTYLQGAALGYDHIHKEIVVTNPAKNYSWVFSLQSKMWFKIAESFERFVQDYPRVYGYRSISTAGTTPFLASSTDISASDDTVLASAEYIEGTITYQLCDISQEDFTALVAVHMETRPLKITANKYKKINRLLIAGRVSDSIINPFSVNLFGSPDDKGWYLMNNGHAFGNKNRLLIGRSLFSCQYFILVFGGYVDEDAYFTHLEIEFEERFGGKLR